ncbi:MAG: DUF4352 domain-containing protein [Eubacteriales bacterium]
MKKKLPLILVVGICLFLLVCVFAGTSTEDTPTKKPASTTTTTTENSTNNKELTFGLNEVAVFQNLQFTAVELKESKGTDYFSPNPGNIFVGIKFTIENISDEEQSISSLLLFEGYVDDIKCDYSFNAACVFDEGTIDGTLAPGKKMVGWYALEVPENWSTIELDVTANWLSHNKARFLFEK